MKEIKPISSPLLNSTNYGSNINEVIRNIDDNFTILSNRDFVKGDKGNSINVQTVNVIEEPSILNGLKNAVKRQFNNTPKKIDNIDVMDWFDDPGTITLIFEKNDSEEILISSLPYVFKDKRFSNIANASNVENYDNETDYSCAIYYNNSEFIAVQEFPTLYFDAEQGCFCWKINGVETGLEATGPKGENGENGVFKIVKAEPRNPNIDLGETVTEDIYTITAVMSGTSIISAQVGEDQESICNAHGIHGGYYKDDGTFVSGTSVMVLVDKGGVNETYLSEVERKRGNSVTYNAMVVKCSMENMISQLEVMSNDELVQRCNDFFNSKNNL